MQKSSVECYSRGYPCGYPLHKDVKKCQAYMLDLLGGGALPYWIGILIFIFLSCTVPTPQPKTLPERDLDPLEQIIIDLITPVHELKALPFITYEILDIDEDTFYLRYYLYAMIDDIDSRLRVHNSYIYPFAFTFDKEKDKLIRYYFPDEQSVFTAELYDNFSLKARQQLINISHEVHLNRINKLRSTNLWNAESYYEQD